MSRCHVGGWRSARTWSPRWPSTSTFTSHPRPPAGRAGCFRGVLAREGSEHSATETISETLEAAEPLATLVPQYVDAFARAVITDDFEAEARAGLRDAGGRDLQDRVSTSPSWRQLLVACAGDEPHQLLAVQLRPAPPQHRQVQPPTPRPDSPRHRPHPDRQTGQMGQAMDRLAGPNRARSKSSGRPEVGLASSTMVGNVRGQPASTVSSWSPKSRAMDTSRLRRT